MIGLNHVSWDNVMAARGQQVIFNYGLGLQGGYFFRDQTMLGIRLNHDAGNIGVEGSPTAGQSRSYESQLFLRRYHGQGRLSLFSEVGSGFNVNQFSGFSVPELPSAWVGWLSRTGVQTRPSRSGSIRRLPLWGVQYRFARYPAIPGWLDLGLGDQLLFPMIFACCHPERRE
jgi:hypothetical protein